MRILDIYAAMMFACEKLKECRNPLDKFVDFEIKEVDNKCIIKILSENFISKKIRTVTIEGAIAEDKEINENLFREEKRNELIALVNKHLKTNVTTITAALQEIEKFNDSTEEETDMLLQLISEIFRGGKSDESKC